jgi:hypothetical protein
MRLNGVTRVATVKQPQSHEGIDHNYDIEPRWLSDAEWWELFDAQARQRLGMGAGEFIAAWKAGDLDDESKYPHGDVIAVLMMWPELELSNDAT